MGGGNNLINQVDSSKVLQLSTSGNIVAGSGNSAIQANSPENIRDVTPIRLSIGHIRKIIKIRQDACPLIEQSLSEIETEIVSKGSLIQARLDKLLKKIEEQPLAVNALTEEYSAILKNPELATLKQEALDAAAELRFEKAACMRLEYYLSEIDILIKYQESPTETFNLISKQLTAKHAQLLDATKNKDDARKHKLIPEINNLLSKHALLQHAQKHGVEKTLNKHLLVDFDREYYKQQNVIYQSLIKQEEKLEAEIKHIAQQITESTQNQKRQRQKKLRPLQDKLDKVKREKAAIEEYLYSPAASLYGLINVTEVSIPQDTGPGDDEDGNTPSIFARIIYGAGMLLDILSNIKIPAAPTTNSNQSESAAPTTAADIFTSNKTVLVEKPVHPITFSAPDNKPVATEQAQLIQQEITDTAARRLVTKRNLATPATTTPKRYIITMKDTRDKDAASIVADKIISAFGRRQLADVRRNIQQVIPLLNQVGENQDSMVIADLSADEAQELSKTYTVAKDSIMYTSEELPATVDGIGYFWHLDATIRNNIFTRPDNIPGKERTVDLLIIDTMIKHDHPAFAGIEILEPFTTLPPELTKAENNRHGTGVTDIATRVLKGITGVRVKPITVMGSASTTTKGQGNISDIIQGLNYAVKYCKGKMCVINMSISGPKSAELDAAVESAINAGIIVVVAAGNDGADACKNSPAGVLRAITIGGLDFDNSLYVSSNTGSCVDYYLPAVNILEAVTFGGSKANSLFGYLTGTSMASPLAAGIIAVLLKLGATAKTIDAKLKELATDIQVADDNLSIGTGTQPNSGKIIIANQAIARNAADKGFSYFGAGTSATDVDYTFKNINLLDANSPTSNKTPSPVKVTAAPTISYAGLPTIFPADKKLMLSSTKQQITVLRNEEIKATFGLQFSLINPPGATIDIGFSSLNGLVRSDNSEVSPTTNANIIKMLSLAGRPQISISQSGTTVELTIFNFNSGAGQAETLQIKNVAPNSIAKLGYTSAPGSDTAVDFEYSTLAPTTKPSAASFTDLLSDINQALPYTLVPPETSIDPAKKPKIAMALSLALTQIHQSTILSNYLTKNRITNDTNRYKNFNNIATLFGLSISRSNQLKTQIANILALTENAKARGVYKPDFIELMQTLKQDPKVGDLVKLIIYACENNKLKTLLTQKTHATQQQIELALWEWRKDLYYMGEPQMHNFQQSNSLSYQDADPDAPDSLQPSAATTAAPTHESKTSGATSNSDNNLLSNFFKKFF